MQRVQTVDAIGISDKFANENFGQAHVKEMPDASVLSGVGKPPYNTPGMFRGWVTSPGKEFVATHEEIYEITL